jgi:hypothetical protein
MRWLSSLWVQALIGGATAGLLAEILVLRLNPEVSFSLRTVAVGALMWVTWGAVSAGLILLGVLAGAARLRRRRLGSEPPWLLPETLAFLFVVAAVGSWINADIHEPYLTGAGHRTLGQDAVAWAIAAAIALAGGRWVRSRPESPRRRLALTCALVALPVLRVATQPTPTLLTSTVAARPLGTPRHPLIVIGVEGLDGGALLTHGTSGRFQTLAGWLDGCAWGPLTPHRPHLRRSQWTSLATGALPRRHGVKSRWAWRVQWSAAQPLRLLPWSPGGSRGILPWFAVRRVRPPESSLPALWERLRASGTSTTALGWPGLWHEGVLSKEPPPSLGLSRIDPDFRAALDAALSRFPEERAAVHRAIDRDLARLHRGVEALGEGHRNLWIYVEMLSAARRKLEPLSPLDTEHREVIELVLELLDQELAAVFGAAPDDTLVAVVSPYGLDPPHQLERLRRVIGLGDQWRATAETCADGVLVLCGPGVAGPQRYSTASLPDLAPTLCYLLGLPVAQYMEGRVLLDAIDPAFVATHPLRVVD